MAREHRAADHHTYRMDVRNPHQALEPIEQEIAVVDGALAALVSEGILPHADYDRDRMLAHREAVAALFEIPWTAITPRMQRLIWSINAIARPANMIAAGVFCGNTFISNAGAAVGPGAVYSARNLIGVEIQADEAERAERNVRRIDPSGVARVAAADAVEVVRDFAEPIDLLYLDATGSGAHGKGVNYDVLMAAYPRLAPGAVVMVHNSFNAADALREYLAFVRDPAHMRASVNAIVDGEGLEVSVR